MDFSTLQSRLIVWSQSLVDSVARSGPLELATNLFALWEIIEYLHHKLAYR